jgi:hypothetical protein
MQQQIPPLLTNGTLLEKSNILGQIILLKQKKIIAAAGWTGSAAFRNFSSYATGPSAFLLRRLSAVTGGQVRKNKYLKYCVY